MCLRVGVHEGVECRHLCSVFVKRDVRSRWVMRCCFGTERWNHGMRRSDYDCVSQWDQSRRERHWWAPFIEITKRRHRGLVGKRAVELVCAREVLCVVTESCTHAPHLGINTIRELYNHSVKWLTPALYLRDLYLKISAKLVKQKRYFPHIEPSLK